MKFFQIVLTFLFFHFSVFSQENSDSLLYMNFTGNARLLYSEGKFIEAHKAYLDAFSLKKQKPWKNDLINMSKTSIKCNCDNPVKYLALEMKIYDYFEAERIISDTIFSKVQGHEDFNKVLIKNRKKIEKAKMDFPKHELLMLEKVYFEDQKDRKEWKEIEERNGRNSEEYKRIVARVMKNDSDRVFKVLEFIKEYGRIPRDEIISKEANSGIFLSIQHSAFPIQKIFYPYIRKSLDYGGFRLSEFALFEDRYRLSQNSKQLYGTQVARNDSGYYLREVENPKGLNQRRKIMGLPPINDYLKRWNIRFEEPKD